MLWHVKNKEGGKATGEKGGRKQVTVSVLRIKPPNNEISRQGGLE